MTEQIKALNNQDTVAQIARLDKCADEDKADKVLAKVNQLLVELTAFKNAIKESDGEFEIPIDPYMVIVWVIKTKRATQADNHNYILKVKKYDHSSVFNNWRYNRRMSDCSHFAY